MTHVGRDVRDILSVLQMVLTGKMLHSWIDALGITEADERPCYDTEMLAGNCWYRAVGRASASAAMARGAGVEQLFSMCGVRLELHDGVELRAARRAGVAGDRRGADTQQRREQKHAANVGGRTGVHHEWIVKERGYP